MRQFTDKELNTFRNKFTYDVDTDTLYRKYNLEVRPAKLSTTTQGYLRVGLSSNLQITVHRLIWFLVYKEFPRGEIDHINGDRKDNRLTNLRLVSKSQNQRNRKPNSVSLSKYKGVYKSKTIGSWISSITFEGKRYYLGTFNCETSAAIAYNKKSKELNDTYRRINK